MRGGIISGSFGNGSAMRVSPVAWFEDKEHRVMELAKRSAEVTHDHPEGIKGAQATAMAILWARSGVTRNRILRDIEAQFEYDLSIPVDELRDLPVQRNLSADGAGSDSVFLRGDGL